MKHNFLSFRAVLLAFLLMAGMTAFAAVTVQGTVTDAANGEPIIGASVLEVGTTNGTITDFDGNFTMTVQPGAQITISYMGYKSQTLNAAPSMNVRLGEDTELLDEVVVVGYGVVKKNDATGSVTAIKPDDMNKGLTTNATDMLSGKIAGVSVTSNDGTPGGGATIRIRGGSSMSASNDPLIVIDGLAMDNDGVKGVANPLSMVNPADIESFTVLKDASATAIYGSRASNGVIIITTKKGNAGQKLKVSYNGNVSFGSLLQRVDVMDAEALRSYAQDLYNDAVMNPATYRPKNLNYLGASNTNWQNEIYRLAISTDHNISLMGGTKNMPYRVSIGYTDQNGIIKTSNMQRVTASVNLNPSFLDKHLVFNLNAKGMYIYNRYAPGVVGGAIAYDPTVPVKGEASSYLTGERLGASQAVLDQIFGGYFGFAQAGSALNDSEWTYQKNGQSPNNPLNSLAFTKDRANSGSFVGNLEVDYKIHGFEDLRLHANFGADYSYGKQRNDIDPRIDDSYNNYYGSHSVVEESKYNLSFNAYAQYYKDFTEEQHFDIMAGGEYQKFHRTGYSESYQLYPLTNKDPNLAGTKRDYKNVPYGTQSALLSFFGRANWVGWNQVMATVTLRADASTRFAPNVRWGLFPSVALGWKIKETFLKDVNWLNDLKLRLGYGITGQQNIADAFQYLAQYEINKLGAWSTLGEKPSDVDLSKLKEDVDYQIGQDGYVYYKTYRPGVYNPDLTWEKTTTYNVGLDYAFLNNRISGSIDYYYRVTNDLINYVFVPAGTNFKTKATMNVGALTNQGVEFAINAVAIDRKNFKWDIGYNVAWNDNRIRKLYGYEDDTPVPDANSGVGNGVLVQAHAVGQPIASFYVYESKVNPNTGLYYLVDQDHPDAYPGDAEYDLTAEDKIFYHSPAAPVTMGFNTKFQFYGVDLGITFHANIGNYVYNAALMDQLQYTTSIYDSKFDGYHNLSKQAFNSYYEDMYQLRNEASGMLATYFVENASFLRCDNITVGYSFNAKNHPLNGRVYCTVSNPFVISKYRGLDPEVPSGRDFNSYPRCMTTVVGLSLNF